MKNELLKGLSKEQIVKVNACKNTEELLELEKVEGVELYLFHIRNKIAFKFLLKNYPNLYKIEALQLRNL